MYKEITQTCVQNMNLSENKKEKENHLYCKVLIIWQQCKRDFNI